MPDPVAISVTVNPKDIARINKRLAKWQGAPLAQRMDKAIRGGLQLLVGPLKVRAARHHRTGKTEAGYKVRKLRKRPGEAAAYKVGSNTRYKHFAIAGTKAGGRYQRLGKGTSGGLVSNSRGVKADPYVDEVRQALEGTVTTYIRETIKRLA